MRPWSEIEAKRLVCLALALMVSFAASRKAVIAAPSCDDRGLTRIDLPCRDAPSGDDIMLTNAVWQASLAVGPAAYHVHGICHIKWAWILPDDMWGSVCGGHLEGEDGTFVGIDVEPFDGMCPGCKEEN